MVVLGNYLYIDGGEVSQISQPENLYSLPNNSTLSIDISKSWNAKTVQIKATPKENGPVPTSDEVLWTDPSGEAFYVLGGRVPRGVGKERLAKDGIWKFTIDGVGGGNTGRTLQYGYAEESYFDLGNGTCHQSYLIKQHWIFSRRHGQYMDGS